MRINHLADSCPHDPDGRLIRIERKGLLTVYRGLPTSVYIVFFSRIVNSIGTLVYPFLTLYLTTKLGYNTAQAGLLMTAGAIAYVPGSLLGGKIADQFGRKLLLVGGMAAAAVLLVPCAFLGTSALIPPLLIASRFFGALADPAYNAMVADLTTPENRKATFSLLYLGHNIGFAIGPMIAGFLFQHHLSWLFLGDAATTFLSVVLVALYVPETHPQAAAVGKVASAGTAAGTTDMGATAPARDLPESERTQTGSVWTILLQRPILLIVAGLFIIYNLVYAQYIFALPVQMETTFGPAGALRYGTLMTTNALTVVALTAVITAVTLRLRSLVSIGLAGIFMAVGFGMMYFIHAMPLFVLSAVIWTVGEILNSVNTGVFIANNSPASHRGRIGATMSLIAGIGWSAGPWLGGLWIRAFTVRTLWIASFFLALAAGLLMLLVSGWGTAESGVAKESAPGTTGSAATTYP
ncbi:MAG: MFS transporter [Symbiobacteriia bacterium]